MPQPPTLTPLRSESHPVAEQLPSAPSPPKPKLKKLRLALVLLGLVALAMVSTLFGMLMAVASDLPALENQAEFDKAENSVLWPDNPDCKFRETDGCEIATLTGNQNRILLEPEEISPAIKNAVVAVEDRRFYGHEGVDYMGIARALWQDIAARSAVQGGSTITQQFVKNALAAQGNRSVFQKLRESALAYHLERRWTKDKILTQYLNTVYFGNGAYGVEAAVRTYFRGDHLEEQQELIDAGLIEEDENDDLRTARVVSPAEAALLAGMISSPSLYDPVQNPTRAKQRRNLVLERMLEEEMITPSEYEDALDDALPDPDSIHPPRPESDNPYFSSWLTQQLVDRYGPGVVFGGGLQIKTTLDPELQTAAEAAISQNLGEIGPSASLVAIENKTGEVKAMVGGSDFEERPFNLATNGHRQPGSAFKPFTLITALRAGVSPEQTYESRPKEFPVPNSGGKETFVVHNYEDQYSGIASLYTATVNSDNSVYAELGLEVGTRKIARLARQMGIATRLSTNPAMTLGGLRQGVTPLEMAYAYSTIANGGVRVSGTLASREGGPVAFEKVEGAGIEKENEKVENRIFPSAVAGDAKALLEGVVLSGTGENAQIGEFAAGKTGTTENYGDAWFVGFNKELTVAVWVGYADRLQQMETEYAGGPVAGGTFPADIWQQFMTSWIAIREQREAERGVDEDEDDEGLPTTPVAPSEAAPAEEESETADEPADAAPRQESRGQAPQSPPAPEPEPAPPPTPAPAPAPAPPPTGGGGAPSGGTGPG
jgi:penicillin-binding protein 1A